MRSDEELTEVRKTKTGPSQGDRARSFRGPFTNFQKFNFKIVVSKNS